MSTETPGISDVATDDTVGASDVEVTEAVEALVRSVEAESAAKSAKKPRAKAKKEPAMSAEALDALVNTVSSLAGSVSTLSGTVETLSDKVANQPASVEVEEQKVEGVTAEEEGGTTPLLLVATNYVCIFALFLGVGLVATASMKHVFGGAAFLMALIGCVLFVASSVVAERKQLSGVVPLVLHAAASLLTVLGLGLLVGGFQNFGDEPNRAAAIIPIGGVLFAIGSVWRARFRLAREHMVWMAGVGVWVCLFLALGLNSLAPDSDDPTPASGNSSVTEVPAAGAHGASEPATAEHGTTAAPDEHATTDEHATEAPATDHPAAGPANHETTPTTEAHAAASTTADHIAEAKEAAKAAASHNEH